MSGNDLITPEGVKLYLHLLLPILIQERNPSVFDDLAKQNANKLLQASMISIIWKNLSELPVSGNLAIVRKWWSAEPQTEEHGPKVDLVEIACDVLHWMLQENIEDAEKYMDIVHFVNFLMEWNYNFSRYVQIPFATRVHLVRIAGVVIRKNVHMQGIKSEASEIKNMEIDEKSDDGCKLQKCGDVAPEIYTLLKIAIRHDNHTLQEDLSNFVEYWYHEFLVIISLIQCHMEEDTLRVVFNKVSPLLSLWLSTCEMLIGKGVFLHQKFPTFQSILDKIERIVIEVLQKNIDVKYTPVLEILWYLWNCNEDKMLNKTCLDFVLRNIANVVRCMLGMELENAPFMEDTLDQTSVIHCNCILLETGLNLLSDFLFYIEDPTETVCEKILCKCVEMRNNYNVFDLVAKHVERISKDKNVYDKHELVISTSKFITQINNKLSTWPPPLVELISRTKLSDICLLALHHLTNTENVDMNTKERVKHREKTAFVRNATEVLITISPENLKISCIMAKICWRPVKFLADSRENFARTNLKKYKDEIYEIENGELDETWQKYFVQPRINHKRVAHISLELAAEKLLHEGYSIHEDYSEVIRFLAVWEKCGRNDLLM